MLSKILLAIPLLSTSAQANSQAGAINLADGFRGVDRVDQISTVLRNKVLLELQNGLEAQCGVRAFSTIDLVPPGDTPFQGLLNDASEFGEYLGLHFDVREAIGDAFNHAYTGSGSDGLALVHQLNLNMGGVPTSDNEARIYATYPDSLGRSVLSSGGGGSAHASRLDLVPSFFFQGTAPNPDHAVYYYFAVLTDGSQHSGTATENIETSSGQLVLHPDTIPGTTIFPPNEQMLLRWAITEIPGLDIRLLFDYLIPPFNPPTSESVSQDGMYRQGQGLEATLLCCQAALQQWKTNMMGALDYLTHWERKNQFEFDPQYEALENEIKEKMGSHAVDVVFNDGFLMDTGGMSPDEAWELIDGFVDKLKDIDDLKKQIEANMEAFKSNAIAYHKTKLRNALLICLEGWPNAANIADEIADNAIEYIF